MKRMFLAAVTVLSLGAGVANAQSFNHSFPSQATSHQGPYDNTANSLNRNTVGGGG
jgi:hypothetical protein